MMDMAAQKSVRTEEALLVDTIPRFDFDDYKNWLFGRISKIDFCQNRRYDLFASLTAAL